MNFRGTKDMQGMSEQELFVGVPGKAGFFTAPEVRGAQYRIAEFLAPTRNLQATPQFRVTKAKIPATRLQKHLRSQGDGARAAGKYGWLVVSSHWHTPVPRCWVMPLGMGVQEARQHFFRHNESLRRHLRLLGLPTGVTMRLLLTTDQIEHELGVTNCRAMWRQVRKSRQEMPVDETLPAVSKRASMGHALVAAHPEMMAVVGQIAEFAEALVAATTYLRTKTTIKAKIRDVEAYLRFAHPVALQNEAWARAREARQAGRPALQTVPSLAKTA